jgi:rubrerythrin
MTDPRLMQLIDTAIKREEEAFDFYMGIIGKVNKTML